MKSPKIIVAGASGYIGRALLPKLLEKFPDAQITALSRSKQKSDDPRIQWKPCDLFSIHSIEEALPEKADLAFYFVHSMGPTAQLDQGSFADYDLILADNFARALIGLQIKHVIYLGGLIPDSDSLSLHLKSRLEVEKTFASYELPLTVFRAALILGEDGSSFQILLKLAKRLPIMVCPRWTRHFTTPIDVGSVIFAITTSALDPSHLGKVYDLAGCEPLTYIEMMRQTALRLNKKRWLITVPLVSPNISALWVSVITNTSLNLVYPLVQSLQHDMIARKNHLFNPEWSKQSYSDLLDKASLKTHSGPAFFQFRAQRKTVRSVQRLPLPKGRDAEWIKDQYLRWLPKYLAPFVRVRFAADQILFSLFTKKPVLLDLKYNRSRSSSELQLFNIEKGLLVAKHNQGRLEFRVVLNRQYVIAAIHGFSPSLPWYIYRRTQATLHLWVMRAFSRYLLRSK